MGETPSANAAAFMAANRKHAVVEGKAFGLGGQGGMFRLTNDEWFDLTAEDCKAVAPMWWVHQENPHA